MFQQWLDQMNLFLLTHPNRLAELEFWFRVKNGVMMALMGYFVYLIYRDQKARHANRKPVGDRFVA